MLEFDLPPPKAEGKATSSFDLGTIDRRLAALAGRDDDASREEVAFLEKLRAELAAEQ
jgi:hypothetical protein